MRTKRSIVPGLTIAQHFHNGRQLGFVIQQYASRKVFGKTYERLKQTNFRETKYNISLASQLIANYIYIYI